MPFDTANDGEPPAGSIADDAELLNLLRLEGTSEEDCSTLSDWLGGALPEALDAFYAHLQRQPQIAKIMANSDIAGLKKRQTEHWRALFASSLRTSSLRVI